MSKKIQLEIPEPCNKNWDKMTPFDKGRFCDSCQKAVVDFTGMSDAQLVSGSSVKIELKKSEQGEFNVDLISQVGQTIYSSVLNFTSKKEVIQLKIPSVITGNYMLQLTNKKTGKRNTEKIIIQ